MNGVEMTIINISKLFISCLLARVVGYYKSAVKKLFNRTFINETEGCTIE